MQCGRGARPEWAGKRLVAVKRMKKQWEGGWDECQKLKELEVRSRSLAVLYLPRCQRRPAWIVVARNPLSPQHHSSV